MGTTIGYDHACAFSTFVQLIFIEKCDILFKHNLYRISHITFKEHIN